jgi:hypothetical protein
MPDGSGPADIRVLAAALARIEMRLDALRASLASIEDAITGRKTAPSVCADLEQALADYFGGGPDPVSPT